VTNFDDLEIPFSSDCRE